LWKAGNDSQHWQWLPMIAAASEPETIMGQAETVGAQTSTNETTCQELFILPETNQHWILVYTK
jgi:hypothetical protein